jgi:hypothetical protein
MSSGMEAVVSVVICFLPSAVLALVFILKERRR